MMLIMRPLFATTLMILMGMSLTPSARSESIVDHRMQVEIQANPEEQGQGLNELHTNIRYAAELALSHLWDRIIPRHARSMVPANTRAIRFMQRAQPTATGVSISFDPRRVLDFLQTSNIPVIPEQPVWNLDIHMRNAAGQNMAQSASLLQDFAREQAAEQGFGLNPLAASIIMQWRWLDTRQVTMSVRGNSRLAEFQETRMLTPGDPLPQLQQWLVETLLKARDAYASGEPQTETPVVVTTPAVDIYGNPIINADPYAAATSKPVPVADDGILISIEHQASLPEQVLFEDDLRRDPRVVSLIPRELNQNTQQYRVKLKEPSDTQWLSQWFTQHGLSLTQTPDGWLAR
jgi:hypothetical protein